MSNLKNLLAAASLLIAAGTVHATIVDVTGTIAGAGTPVTGSIDIDQDVANPNGTLAFFFGATINAGGNTWTATNLFTPASPDDGRLSDVNAIPPSALEPSGAGFRVTYEWGDQSANSNAASTFTGTGGSAWDWAQLIVEVDGTFAPTSIVLNTREYSSAEAYDETTYNLEMVPVPAAAWLFGSGLVGLAGAARRRRAA